MFRVSLLLFCLAISMTGCGKGKTDSDSSNSTNSSPDKSGKPSANEVDLSTAKADITTTPKEWHAEFKKDPAAAAKKYRGKVVELSGTVQTLAENADAGVLFVHLKVEGDVLGVRCGFKDLTLWEKVVDGATITVRGQIPELQFLTGELMPVALVKVEKNPAEKITAVEMTKQFKADLTKLKEKFDNKWVYVEGEVASVGKNSNGGPQFTLKGDGGIDIVCTVPFDSAKQVEALKVGQKVKVVGLFGAYTGDQAPSLSMVMFKVL